MFVLLLLELPESLERESLALLPQDLLLEFRQLAQHVRPAEHVLIYAIHVIHASMFCRQAKKRRGVRRASQLGEPTRNG